MTDFRTDGVRLAVQGDFAPRTMVFQHGLCGAAGQPAAVFPDIGTASVTLECRGHGGSEAGPEDALSIRRFADDLVALIEARAEAPVVLGGISMGAAIALRIAVTRPELVSGLVLARPAWFLSDAPANMIPNWLAGHLMAEDPATAEAAFRASPIFRLLEETGPDNLASILGFFARERRDTTAALLTRIPMDGPGVTGADLRDLDVPTLVIATLRDPVHPVDHATALAASIPGARLELVTPKATGADRHRAEFRATLATFLEEISA